MGIFEYRTAKEVLSAWSAEKREAVGGLSKVFNIHHLSLIHCRGFAVGQRCSPHDAVLGTLVVAIKIRTVYNAEFALISENTFESASNGKCFSLVPSPAVVRCAYPYLTTTLTRQQLDTPPTH